ncbi:hypothetical protein CBS101457_003009 [Exobasidium rhododendri]|nr:hypothetical protein CBS101457_003009 [Exobasidium rhododendri]
MVPYYVYLYLCIVAFLHGTTRTAPVPLPMFHDGAGSSNKSNREVAAFPDPIDSRPIFLPGQLGATPGYYHPPHSFDTAPQGSFPVQLPEHTAAITGPSRHDVIYTTFEQHDTHSGLGQGSQFGVPLHDPYIFPDLSEDSFHGDEGFQAAHIVQHRDSMRGMSGSDRDDLQSMKHGATHRSSYGDRPMSFHYNNLPWQQQHPPHYHSLQSTYHPPTDAALFRQEEKEGAPSREYTMPVESTFHAKSESRNLFQSLNDAQRLLIVDRIMQIRPYCDNTTRKKLGRSLDASLARALLSDDVAQIEAAVEKLYPIDIVKYSAKHNTWMTGLTNTERRQVIERVAAATEQDARKLREHFLRKKVTPSVARLLLAANDDACVQYAREYDLIVPTTEGHAVWQKGMSFIQKKALLHRMRAYGVVSDYRCYRLLEKKRVPSGSGLRMLKAGDDQFADIMESLKGNKRTDPSSS